MKKICPNCGVENEENAKFCMNCAAKLSEEITENIPDVEEAEANNEEETQGEFEKKWVCPECNHLIDANMEKCPECGYTLGEDIEDGTDNKQERRAIIKCPECGELLSKKDKVCPKCGYVFKQRKGKIVGAIIAVAIALLVAICVNNYNQQKKAEAEKQQKIEQQEKAKKEAEQLSYKNHFQRAFLLMWTGAYQAQESCGLIHDVWYDTIYNKDESSTRKYVSGHSDFNDSLDALFKDSDFKKDISDLKDSQEEVREDMKYLTNPSDEWKQGYEAISNFYSDYITFTNMAIDPTGNLTSYTQDYNEMISTISTDIETMKIYTDTSTEE